MLCTSCKKLIPEEHVCIQVRKGSVVKDDGRGWDYFEPDEDVGYYHQKCYDEGLLVS